MRARLTASTDASLPTLAALPGSQVSKRTTLPTRLTFVGEAEAPDVGGLVVVGAHHVPEAEVQPEATQGAQASGRTRALPQAPTSAIR